ncbi:MAG: transcription initiation factor IIB family protein [Candidatus Bathyarchaeia archaeon]
MVKARVKEKVKEISRCPECGSGKLIQDALSGEVICGDCGLVVTEVLLSKRPEWRAFSGTERERRSRIGTPYLYSIHDKGLPTTIGRVDIDAFGRSLPMKTRLQMLRLKRWQMRFKAQSSTGRNLSHAAAELDRLSDRLSIPNSVKERAAIIYRKALKKGLVRGRSIGGIAAASLYLACRLTHFPRSLTEISETSLVDKKDIARCYRLLLRTFDMSVPLIDPIQYSAKIVALLNLSDNVRKVAKKILVEALEKRVTAGKDPMGVAAAAIYIASVVNNERRTQKSIANAAGVTEVTVRNRYRGLKEDLDLEALGIEVPD